MTITNRLLRAARRQTWLVVAVLALVYFAFHLVTGDRGLLAWRQVRQDHEAAKAELAEVRSRREALEARVQKLQPDRIDPDLLEEELRRLGYVGAREVVVLPQTDPAPVPAPPR